MVWDFEYKRGEIMKKRNDNFYKNKELRRKNPNIRKIINGKPSSFWDKKVEKSKIPNGRKVID